MKRASERPLVLVVDDDALLCAFCTRLLQEEGLTCETVQSGEAAIARITAGNFDLVLTDLVMPPPDGHAVIAHAQRATSRPAIIAMTAFNETDRRLDALRAGGWGIMRKPLQPIELSRTIAWALHGRAVAASGGPPGHFEALYRMATVANSEGELAATLDRVLGTCAAILKADTGSVMLASSPNASPRTLTIVSSYGLNANHPNSTIAFGERICGWVAANRRPLRLVGGTGGYPQFEAVSSNPELAESLVAPIEFRQETLGTISVSSRTPGTLGPEALGFLVSAAELAAASIYRERLLRSNEHRERLALIGQLSVSVAHELNNPLTYVRANIGHLSELLSTATSPQILFDRRTSMLESVKDADEGVGRMVSLVDSLRTSARKSTSAWQVLDVNALLKQAEKMVAPQVKHRAELVVECGDCPTVWGDPNRILQVLINLLVNAAQAVGPAGKVLLTSRADGNRAMIAVCDNGPGVSPEVARRLFEPFFTTKPDGEGTGLGLSISRQIARDHGGQLVFSGAVGKGSTFTLELPAAEVDAAVKPVVLVVDDEELVVRSIARLLEPTFVVITALGANEGVAAAHNRKLDIILTDFAMPGQNGVDLVRALREQGHAAPAVLITAMSEAPQVVEALGNGVVTAVMKKPWPASLLGEVLRLIGRPGSQLP